MKIKQAEKRELQRSEINLAAYNPRKITAKARKKLKANLVKFGLMGGIVWNETTGNLVSGHQRLSIMDEVQKYNPETGENDYPVQVEVTALTEKEEKEQNLFMNNSGAQGEFDNTALRAMLPDLDYSAAGFEAFDVSVLGIWDNVGIEPSGAGEWKADKVAEETGVSPDLGKETPETQMNRRINFYDDTEENQIKRHNEIAKIKDRINRQNDTDKDGGALSYVVLSFEDYKSKQAFMLRFGLGINDKYVDGDWFGDIIERTE